MIPDAKFSEPDRTRRFWLTRDWSDELPVPQKTVNFIMLNPSKADEERPDPTITRCVEFAKRWRGFSRLVATNLIPIVQTYPARLPPWSDIDAENKAHLVRWIGEADLVVVAWGGSLKKEIAERIDLAKHISALRENAPVDLHCIGHTKTRRRHPFHPSRVAYTEDPILWKPE
ncbi:MAG: DUF1643 domain-containing protein [Bryobacteraceae bacterium]